MRVSCFVLLLLVTACQDSGKEQQNDSLYTAEQLEVITMGPLPDYHYNLANEMINNDRLEEAIQAYRDCIVQSSNPNTVENAMYNLSDLLFAEGQTEEAYELFDQLIERRFVWLNWYRNQEGDFTASSAFQDRLTKLDSLESAQLLPTNARFHYTDAEHFVEAFEKIDGNWDQAPHLFFHDYFSRASKGLAYYHRFKIGASSNFFANRIADREAYFSSVVSNLSQLSTKEEELRAYLVRFSELYPAATFPDIYFVVGGLAAGGTSSPFGLIIGADFYAKSPDTDVSELNSWEQTVVTDFTKLPLITIHELVHIQQNQNYNKLLGNAIFEGAADFVSELVCGAHINEYVHDWANPMEAEIWAEFQEEMHGRDASNWIGNGNNAVDKPADLGYYVGYKICESYYEQQPDKQQALVDILQIEDYDAFFAASGYGGGD